MTPVPTPGTRSGQTSRGSLADEVALKFSQGTKDVKDEFSPRCGRIDIFLHTLKANPSISQVLTGVNKVADAAAKPV